MPIFARSSVSRHVHSFDTGVDLARTVRTGFGHERLAGILAYATVSHDQKAFLAGIRHIVGPFVPVIGCSGQGVMGLEAVAEDGYVAGIMGLGGESLHFTPARAEQFGDDSIQKAREVGKTLRGGAQGPLRVVLVHYDPLCGADVEVFLDALHKEVACPIVGGAAAEFWGPMEQTFQYSNDRAMHGAVVAVGLSGDFTSEADVCDGTSPLGIEMTVTRAEGNKVLEFDGRPALDVWQEFCSEAPERLGHSGAIGVGLPTNHPDIRLVRCVFGVDQAKKGIVFQAAIPVGSRLTFNHRTVDGALDGTAAMAQRISARLRGRTVRAVLGFECGARSKPFLGKEATFTENRDLQRAVAPNAAWLGMFAWGEVSMFDDRPRLVNFSFPLLALAD
ncbi:MAG: FIST N-terminal domain-containing protein [Polyangiaceae bacterium]|jgi:hypothetical protein